MLRSLSGAVALVACALAPAAGAAPRGCAPGPFRSMELISAQTGAKEQTYPGAYGMTSVLADGHGGWFVAGSISCLGGVRAASILHLDRRGRLDRRWRIAHVGPVGALALAGGRLYTTTAYGVETFAAATGARGWRVRVSGGAVALAAGPSTLFVAGDFTRIAGAARSSLAALDPHTGALLAWRPPDIDGFVGALALDGTRLFVGGGFSRIDALRRPGLAELDSRSGSLAAWTPGTAPGLNAGVGDVETIVVSGGAVFTAGHDGYGITDERTGAISPLMRQVISAQRFTPAGELVYVGGDLRTGLTVSGDAPGRPRSNLAALDLSTGRLTRWAPHLAVYVDVSAIAAGRRGVLVVGGFSQTLG